MNFHWLLIIAAAMALPTRAQTNTALSVAPVFGDHMVLQQEKPVPV